MKFPTDFINQVIQGDCLEVMKQMPDKCVDLVLTDPPYGTTGNEWDNIVDFWDEIKRICKGGFVIFSSQPYTTDLINLNRKDFKYQWIWNKKLAGNGILAGKQPLKIHEEVNIFGDVNFYPIKTKGRARMKGGIKDKHGTFGGSLSKEVFNDDYHPVSILEFSGAGERITREHPTQKPLELLKYLVKSYSKETDLILDPFLGSGTTAVAAKQLNRRFIGIEISEKYCQIARDRLRQEVLRF